MQHPTSHGPRLFDYVHDVYGSKLPSLITTRAHGLSKKFDRVLMLGCGSAPPLSEGSPPAAEEVTDAIHRRAVALAAARELAACPFLGRALSRCYLVDEVFSEWAQVLSFFRSVLESIGRGRMGTPQAAPGPLLEVGVRSQCYPNTLEIPLVEQLEKLDISVDTPGSAALKLVPKPLMQGWQVLLTIVQVDGYYYCSHAVAGSPEAAAVFWGKQALSEVHSVDGAVCRAQYKLREVMQRTSVFARILNRPSVDGSSNNNTSAIDVGAAPGGWSVCLAEDCGFQTVYAVDPGQLTKDRPLPPAIVHMKLKGEQAVDQLLKEGKGQRLDGYTCDMNVPTSQALDVFFQAMPLLRSGAAVVITLKNFDGTIQLWKSKVDEAVERLKTVCDAGGVQVLHLMSNGEKEVTAVGNLK